MNKIEDVKLQRSALLSFILLETFRMLADFFQPETLDTVDYNSIVKKLDNQYCIRSSRLAACVQFARVNLFEGQSMDEYFADLRKASQEFNFGNQLEERLRDQLLVVTLWYDSKANVQT